VRHDQARIAVSRRRLTKAGRTSLSVDGLDRAAHARPAAAFAHASPAASSAAGDLKPSRPSRNRTSPRLSALVPWLRPIDDRGDAADDPISAPRQHSAHIAWAEERILLRVFEAFDSADFAAAVSSADRPAFCVRLYR